VRVKDNMQRKVLLQGDLTSDCGFYAVINAISQLLGWTDRDEDRAQALYRHLLQCYEKKWNLTVALTKGTNDNQFRFLIEQACKWVAEQFDVRVGYEEPNGHVTPSRLQQFLDVVRKKRIALAALKDEGHWTCIRKVSNGRYYYCDSGPVERYWSNAVTIEKVFILSVDQ
jgi:hypothetical protein